jgi:hypothetical protein
VLARRIVVDRVTEREVYLHNVLEELLMGIDERFDQLTDTELKPGWKSEAVNGLIVLAMVNEGWVNAVGEKSFSDWNPKQKAEKRLHRICEKLLPECSFTDRPLVSVDAVRRIRNEFAHAIPLIETRLEKEVVIEEGDHRGFFSDLGHPVEDEITPDSYRQFREDSETFRLRLLERSGLGVWDVRTRSEEQSTFIREAD